MFWKARLIGSALGQDIQNILYYGPLVPGVGVFDPGVGQELGEAINDAFKASVLPYLTSRYSFQGCVLSEVDADGTVTSPYEVVVPATGNGGDDGHTTGADMVAIVALFTESFPTAGGRPVPKRSYLALGPITVNGVGTDGILMWTQATRNAIVAWATGGHQVGASVVVPYRVTRPTPRRATGALGRVVSAQVRPYKSQRESRERTPTGRV